MDSQRVRYNWAEIFILKSMKCFKIIDLAKILLKFYKNKKSKIIVKNQKDLVNYLRKNLIDDEIVIGMGAGLITHWMRGLKSTL